MYRIVAFDFYTLINIVMIKIKRTYLNNATTGDAKVVLEDKEIFSFKTLELPWKLNEKFVSCIPAGTYDCVRRKTPKYGDHFHITNVPNRDMILIHFGNYAAKDSTGCVLPGENHIDMDKDGTIDVTNSKATMKKLVSILPPKFKLEIT